MKFRIVLPLEGSVGMVISKKPIVQGTWLEMKGETVPDSLPATPKSPPPLPGTQSMFIEPMNESNSWVLPSPAQSVDLSEPQAPGVCEPSPPPLSIPSHPSPHPWVLTPPPPHSRSWRLTSRLRKGPGRSCSWRR